MIYDPRSIHLSTQQQDRIAELAERAGLPWEMVLSDFLHDFAIRAGSPFPGRSLGEIADQLGVIGCMESGIGDLSTNPAHMEGFGKSHSK